ncbi:MAG: NAD-dependent epimerase/dehydratase family protein [Myxococcales bacterium]|nr:MAG: NAD-dependent epimerase/dehydratase family protein [Myxococcales bacterium]
MRRMSEKGSLDTAGACPGGDPPSSSLSTGEAGVWNARACIRWPGAFIILKPWFTCPLSSEEAEPVKSMLIYGATGKAGRLVMERAVEAGYAVSAFVRNPDRVPAALRSRVTIVKGDLCDASAVTAAVKSSRPDVIVDASSALPFGHARGQPANNADRATLTRATVSALEAEGRLGDCVFLIVGGQLVPEPGGTIHSWSVAAMAWFLRTVVARKALREATELLAWCFQQAPPTFRFVYARMGYMVEEPSRGSLRAEPTRNNIQHGRVSYADVADAFVRLAGDEGRTWERKALFFNYERPATP